MSCIDRRTKAQKPSYKSSVLNFQRSGAVRPLLLVAEAQPLVRPLVSWSGMRSATPVGPQPTRSPSALGHVVRDVVSWSHQPERRHEQTSRSGGTITPAEAAARADQPERHHDQTSRSGVTIRPAGASRSNYHYRKST